MRLNQEPLLVKSIVGGGLVVIGLAFGGGVYYETVTCPMPRSSVNPDTTLQLDLTQRRLYPVDIEFTQTGQGHVRGDGNYFQKTAPAGPADTGTAIYYDGSLKDSAGRDGYYADETTLPFEGCVRIRSSRDKNVVGLGVPIKLGVDDMPKQTYQLPEGFKNPPPSYIAPRRTNFPRINKAKRHS